MTGLVSISGHRAAISVDLDSSASSCIRESFPSRSWTSRFSRHRAARLQRSWWACLDSEASSYRMPDVQQHHDFQGIELPLAATTHRVGLDQGNIELILVQVSIPDIELGDYCPLRQLLILSSRVSIPGPIADDPTSRGKFTGVKSRFQGIELPCRQITARLDFEGIELPARRAVPRLDSRASSCPDGYAAPAPMAEPRA